MDAYSRPSTMRPNITNPLIGFDPRRLWSIALRRAPLFVIIAGIVAVAILVLAASSPPQFKASASILIDPQRKTILETQGSSQSAPPDTNTIDTEVQLVSSPQLARLVAQKLNLAADPEFAPPPGANDPQQAVVDNLQRHVLIRRSGLTYVITVTATSRHRQTAARLANAFVTEYVAQQLTLKADADRGVNAALDERLGSMQQQVAAADAAVQQYKIRHNLISAVGGTLAQQEVSDLNQQIATARADLTEKEARLSVARAQMERGGGGADVGAALGSDTIRQLRAQEADASRQLADLARYGPRHPDKIKAESQLADIREKIQLEINRIISSLQADVQASQRRLSSLNGSLGQARGSLASNGAAEAGLLALEDTANANRKTYEAALGVSRQAAAQDGLEKPDARIISMASPPREKASPNLRLAAVFAAAAGAVAGLFAVLLVELMDSGVQTGSDVERRFGVRYAGTVPTLSSTGKGLRKAKPQDYVVSHPLSTFAESFRSLRTFMMLPGPNEVAPKVVTITSALPGEGKTLGSLCLARTIALTGSKVILVDCDLRQRAMTRMTNPGAVGLQEVLMGEAPLDAAMVRDEASGAYLLPFVRPLSDGMDLFSRPAMDKLLGELRSRFDFVLLDTAPVLAVSETREVAAKSDGVLMMTRWRKTPAKAVDVAIDLLLESNSRLLGVALSRANLKEQVRLGYGDRYYYYNAYKNYYVG